MNFQHHPEYSVQLLDPAGAALAGASFHAADDDAAADEARELAMLHDWARRARIVRKHDGFAWTIEV